ncbi:MAG: WecB/TagA/CpsF family glycosyltransferase [Bacteroidia bacterium]|nr:WecB/TagA/CpsF family glycosyltransferase [Bacteroidia bacterium]
MVINTINPHSFYVADHDEAFKHALKRSSVLLPDGVGIVYANFFLNKVPIRRIPGYEIFIYVMQMLERSTESRVKRVFFLGSTPEVLATIEGRIKTDFPSLQVGVYSPPFKQAFSDADDEAIASAVNEFNPHVLFVGMTAPKQEKWVAQNHRRINAPMICSIGAVFDFYARKVVRPGSIWQSLGLEWFRRLINEPKRLWRRTFVSLPYFLRKVLSLGVKRALPQAKT